MANCPSPSLPTDSSDEPEFPIITDSDEHWLSFHRARGGTTAFFSEEGQRIELDNTPIQDRLREALGNAENVPVQQTLNTLSRWFDEHATQQQWSWQDELDDDPERFLELQETIAHPRELTPLEKVAMLSRTMLNSTFCIVQSAPNQRER